MVGATVDRDCVNIHIHVTTESESLNIKCVISDLLWKSILHVSIYYTHSPAKHPGLTQSSQ